MDVYDKMEELNNRSDRFFASENKTKEEASKLLNDLMAVFKEALAEAGKKYTNTLDENKMLKKENAELKRLLKGKKV